jgi:hypothetical protein
VGFYWGLTFFDLKGLLKIHFVSIAISLVLLQKAEKIITV